MSKLKTQREVRPMLSIYGRLGPVGTSTALLLLVGTQGFAQRSESSGSSGGLNFTVGWQSVEVEVLNERLAIEGIPNFDEQFLALGFEGYLGFGRWLVGVEGQWLLERDQLTSDYKYSLSGDFGLIDVGYALQLGNLRLYPVTGIGGGRMRFKTVEHATPSFDEVLDDPGRSSELSQLYFLWQVALGMDYLMKLSQETTAVHGVSVGAQVGYMFSFGHRDWKLNGSEVPGGPAIGVEGGYVRLAIGWTRRPIKSPSQ
jgi:hypothetical protein